MRSFVLYVIALLATSLPLGAEETAVVRAADGFQLPVGPNGTGQGYYIARGYRPNGHLGEDWNGVGGGDTDLGDPVYACANGYVTFARNYHLGWGNVVIIRHAYYDGSTLKYCDSLYGHLLDFSVHEGDQVRRGEKIARIGNNFGMYEAHLHFEMRKNLQIGMFRSSFSRDFSNYYTPNEFVAQHHICQNGNHMVNIPINTYPPVAPPVLAGPHVDTPVFGPSHAAATAIFTKLPPISPGSHPTAPAPASTPAPAAKVVITKAATPAPTPVKFTFRVTTTPAPSPESGRKSSQPAATGVTVVVNTATPAPSASTKKTATTTTATTQAEPSVKISTAPAAGASGTATTANSSKHGKSAAPTPASTAKSSAKSSTKSSTVAAAATPTPTPAGKSSKKGSSSASTASTTHSGASAPKTAAKSAATPKPAATTASTKGSKSVGSSKGSSTAPGAIASAAKPTATPAPATATASKSRKTTAAGSPTPPPEAAPATAGAPAARAQTQVVNTGPILPAPTTKDAPLIRRTGSGYKVDRFEDLRGKEGY